MQCLGGGAAQWGEGCLPSSQAALRALQQMAHAGGSAGQAAAATSTARAGSAEGSSSGLGVPGRTPAAAACPPAGAGAAAGGAHGLRVACDAGWVRSSAGRVLGLLHKALPPLCSHPRPSVREALAAGVECEAACWQPVTVSWADSWKGLVFDVG